MWYKWGIPIVTMILAAFIYSDQRPDADPTEELPGRKLVRSAKDISMFETSLAGDGRLTITARELLEHDDRIVQLQDFRIEQDNGLVLRGQKAEYLTTDDLFSISGEVLVETTDGLNARMTGLVWDRRSGLARTDNPVTVKNQGSTIRADRAEFYGNFSEIRFIGGVNAQINNATFFGD